MQKAESRKIAIRRAQNQSVFDGQRSQMGIVDEIGPDAGQAEKLSEGLGISFGRLWNPNRQASKPPGYLAPGIFRVQQSGERPSVGTTRKNANNLGQGKPTRARPLS